LIALALCALDPNMLAHARLVTLDFTATFFVFLSGFALYRFWSRPGLGRLALAGLALGAAGATRFTTAFLAPLFLLLSLARVWRPIRVGPFSALGAPSRGRRLLTALALLLAIGAIVAPVLWLTHGADFGPVPRGDGIRLPAPAYFNDLAALLEYRDKPQDAFLLGRHYVGGWWPYFIVAFFVKTPLPTILLIGIAATHLIRRRDGRFGDAVLLTVAGGYFSLSLLSPFNIGYRHLLPMLPFLFVFASRVTLTHQRIIHRSLFIVHCSLLIWLIITNLAIHPHYLAYFNELVGPRNGYRVLVDSNLDWGQDLPALEQYVAEQNISSLYLSWFGESRPEQYDIPYRFIPSKPDELSDVYTRVYHPDYPPPGVYAISATNLQTLLFDDKDLFAWFLQREPVAQPGYSILIYEVPHLLDLETPPVTVALGSIQIDRVPPTAFENFWRTNDLQLRWFDAKTSCVLPAGADTWYVLKATADDSLLCPLWEKAESVAQLPKRGGEGQLAFYHLSADPTAFDDWLTESTHNSPLIISDEVAFAPGDAPNLRRDASPPLRFGDRLNLLGYRILSDTLHPGSEWQMVSYWQVQSSTQRASNLQLKTFVQLLDDAGNSRAQYDGLDIPVIGWQEGDLLAQRHTLSLPADLSPGRYWIQFGLYATQTVKRLPVLLDGESVGTRLLLPPLEVR